MIIVCDTCLSRYRYDETRFAGRRVKKVRCTKCLTVFEVDNPAFSGGAASTVREGGRGDLHPPGRRDGSSEAAGLRAQAPGRRPAAVRPAGEPLGLPADAKLSLAVIAGPAAGTIFPIEKARDRHRPAGRRFRPGGSRDLAQPHGDRGRRRTRDADRPGVDQRHLHRRRGDPRGPALEPAGILHRRVDADADRDAAVRRRDTRYEMRDTGSRIAHLASRTPHPASRIPIESPPCASPSPCPGASIPRSRPSS